MPIIAGDLIEAAIEHLSLVDIEAVEAVSDPDYAKALPRLDKMLKSDLANGSWRALRERFTVSHIGDVMELKEGGLVKTNPYKVIRVIRNHANAKIHVNRLSEAEYDQLPIHTGGSDPISFFEERQADNSILIRFWPNTSKAQPLTVVVQKRLPKITTKEDEIVLPDEWEEPLSYRLAVRLRPLYGIPIGSIKDIAFMATQTWAELKLSAIESTALELN